MNRLRLASLYRSPLTVGLVVAMLALPAASGWAGEHGRHGGRDDHERAREAVTSGQVLPLRTVLERLEKEFPGQVLEVELEPQDEGWVYEVRLLQADGLLRKVRLDARTAEVLSSRTRPARGEGDSRPR